MNSIIKKRHLRIPFLTIVCMLCLSFFIDTEIYKAADVSGNCASNISSYTCKGHGHSWEVPSTCGTCGGDHTITTGKECTTCRGTGVITDSNGLKQTCSICGGDGKKGETSSSCSKCYSSGTYKGKNTRCTNSGCGYGSYAAWGDYPNGICIDHGTITYDCGNSTVNYGEHASNGVYQYDDNNHWTNCAYCTGKMGTTAHSFGDEYVSGNYRYKKCGCGYEKLLGGIQHTVVYDSNGGSGAPSTIHTKEYGSVVTLSTTVPTRTGYTFTKWNSSADGGGFSVSAGGSYGYDQNGGTVTLYAQWKANTYTITLNPNGGSNGSLSSVTTTYNTSNYYSHGGLVPTRTGYTFLGWYTKASGGSQVYNASGVCVNGTGYWTNNKWVYANNITLYAQWSQNSYKVTYNGNGGSTSAATGTYHYKDEISLKPTASKSGYIFVGWSTSPSATKPLTSLSMPDLATSSNTEYSSDWELTLYALYSINVSDVSNHTYPSYNKVNSNEAYLMVWKLGSPTTYKTYPLTYKADAGIMYYTYQLDSIDISSFVGSSSYGYKVVAYDNAGNYSTLLKGTSTGGPPSSEPDTLVAYWQKVNHYKYDTALGKWVYFDTTSELVAKGSTFTPSYITPPSGFKKDHIDSSYTVSGETTTNAYYSPITYTLTFDPNGGSVSPTSKSIIYNDYYGDMPIPVRKGHSFAGWYTQASGGTEVSDKTIYATNGNSTVYAHWNVNSYNVLYDYWTNGGTSVSKTTATINYNSKIDLSVNAVKSGWTFVGWNTNPDATTGLSSLKMGDDNVILYAIYKKDITATFIDGADKSTNKITTTIYNRATSCTITTRNIAEIDGWKIRGWSFNKQGNATVHVSPNVTYELSADKTFYSCYVQDITISYDTNGSAEVVSSQTKKRFYNASGNYENPVFTTAGAPNLEKHSFVQWEELNADGSVKTFYPANQEIEVSQNLHLTAKWDQHPEIEAYDRYFTLEEAVNGEITADRLLEKVTATDREDGNLVNGKDVIIPGLDQYDFVNNADVTITYQAKDSFGNIVEKNITIHVVDTTVSESPTVYYSRFIGLDFYKNGDNLVTEADGGLKNSSVWRTDETYNRLLESVLFNSKTDEEYKTIDYFGLGTEVKVAGSGTWNQMEETWVFTKADIEAVEEFTLEHGLGNLKETDALEKFFELFGLCKKEN